MKNFNETEMMELVADISEILADLPKWRPIYRALKAQAVENNYTREEFLANLKYCIQIDKEIQQEIAQNSLAKFVGNAMKKASNS